MRRGQTSFLVRNAKQQKACHAHTRARVIVFNTPLSLEKASFLL